MPLSSERCEPCTGSTPKLTEEEVDALRAELDPAWRVDGGRLRRSLRFPDFASALAAAVRAGMIAEGLGHHPDLGVAWGRLDVEIWTHAVGGLTRADMVLAAHVDAALGQAAGPRPSR